MLIGSGLILDLLTSIKLQYSSTYVLRLTWRGGNHGSLKMEAVGGGSHCGGCW